MTSSPWLAEGSADIVAVELQLERDDVLRLNEGWEYARDERGRIDASMVWVNVGVIVSMFGVGSGCGKDKNLYGLVSQIAE